VQPGGSVQVMGVESTGCVIIEGVVFWRGGGGDLVIDLVHTSLFTLRS
jgi:hypothetical protein